MTKDEIRTICEKRFEELGAERIELQPSGECWTLNGEFFKVTTLQSWWILEWTNNRSYASNYCFEDADPMLYDISEEEVITQVNFLIKNSTYGFPHIRVAADNVDLLKSADIT